MRLHFYRTILALCACVGSLCFAPPALADQSVLQCVSQAGNCGANIGKTALNGLAGAEKVLEFAAAHSNCVADIVAANFVTIGVATAMTTLAASGVLKQVNKSYLSYVYGEAAKPMVKAVSALVPVPMLTDLLQNQSEATLGKVFEGLTTQIPMPSVGAFNLKLQLECGDAVAVAGMGMVQSLKKVIGSAKSAVKSCSAAAGCFATQLFDIVTDPVGAVGSTGEFVADTADDVKDFVFGGCKNTPVQDYFNGRFKPRVNEIAYKTVWGGEPGAYGPISKALVDQCVKEYDDCDSDPDTAKRQCVVMSSGNVQTDGNGWIAGKGLEQLVRTRELELGIPKTLDTMAQWVDGQQAERVKAALQAVFGDVAGPLKSKFPKPDTYQATQVAARQAAVRKILGVSGNSKPASPDQKISLPQGSVGALMMGYVETEGPANVAWSYKTGQLLAKYYPELSGNPKLLAQVDEIAKKSLVEDKNLLLSINGENWNKEIAKAEMDKVANGNPAIKGQSCAHGDEACVKKLKQTRAAYELVLVSLGRADNFAGMGAWGVNAPAYQEYLSYIAKARVAVSNITAGSTPNYGKPTLSSMTEVGHAPGAVQTAAPGLPSAAPTAPQVGRPPRPLGMPGLPTMGALPAMPRATAEPQITPQMVPQVGSQAAPLPQIAPAASSVANEAPPVLARVTPSLRIPSVVEPIAPPAAQTPAHAATLPPAGSAATGFIANSPPSIRLPSARVTPPFNAQAYRAERSKALSDQWTPKCKGHAPCLQSIAQLINQRLEVEVQALSANRPSYSDKSALAQYLALQDQGFNPQFDAAIPKTPVVVQPNLTQPIAAPTASHLPPRVGHGLPKIRP